MDLIDAAVLNVALPSIQRELHASSTQLEWSIIGYTLFFASGMITSARLGDRFGRRRVFQLGLAAFTVSSLWTALAVNPEMLVAARVAQGLSASLMVPQVLAMLRAEFPPEEQSRAATIYGLVFSVGGVCAPVLGGLILGADLFGWAWRPIFLVNIPFGIAALIGTAVFARESRAERTTGTDMGGLILVTVAMVSVLYPLIEGRLLDWPVWCFLLMAFGLALLWGFLRYERIVVRRNRSPLIDPQLLRERAPVGGLTVATIFFAGAAYPLVLTVHLQTALGYSPLRTAVTMIPFAVGVGIFSPFATRLRVLGRPLAVIGPLIAVVGMVLVLVAVRRYGTDLHAPDLIPGLLICGIGVSMTSGVLIATVIAKTAPWHAGAAAGLANTAIQLGVAIGVAIVGTTYFGLLDAGREPVTATTYGLLVVIGLFLLASPTAMILPGGRLTFAWGGAAQRSAADGKESAVTTGASAPGNDPVGD
ncbi:MFS transporter [Dactylosporangium roseum]|uniref:MFS transporter n=1 Tax=Dactylosporangium roseum TaxID=47989 RepID=A0ABY5ZEK2_9ACTN|nr:MFS transporter [Dactylosporangium roseum]UWZ39375.1 MFS transporter [Dactylosporangium roseum]